METLETQKDTFTAKFFVAEQATRFLSSEAL